MKTITALIVGLVLGLGGIATAGPSAHPTEIPMSTTPVQLHGVTTQVKPHTEHWVVAPKWMTRTCKTNASVNCWHARANAFIRQFPGRAHMVCVMYVKTPRHDYCVKNAPKRHKR